MSISKLFRIVLLSFFVLTIQKIWAIPLIDSLVLCSVEKCTERLYMYHEPYLCHGDSSKPIYWAKLISLDKERKAWEVVFFETNRKGLFTVKNFTEGVIINKNEYLLFFEYDTLLHLKGKPFLDSIDHSVFYEEENAYDKSQKENNIGILIPFLYANWCCIQYCNNTGSISVYSKEMSPYNLLSNKLKVFELETLYSNLGFFEEDVLKSHFLELPRKELRKIKKDGPRDWNTKLKHRKISKDNQPYYDIEYLRKKNGKIHRWKKSGILYYEFIDKYSFDYNK